MSTYHTVSYYGDMGGDSCFCEKSVNTLNFSCGAVIEMDYLYICNTASDYVSKVNLGRFVEEDKILLCNKGVKIGPHGICCWKSDLITANSYSNSISRIDLIQGRVGSSYYIGRHCNDVAVFEDIAYIICGESNDIVAFELKHNKIIEEMPCGSMPHSIDICKSNGLIAIANMESDSITLIDSRNRDLMKEIKVGNYPAKAIFSRDGKDIFVCESNLGSDLGGTISIVSTETLSVTTRIEVGKAPVDIWCDGTVCYVSNFNEGTVSVIYLEDREEVKRIELGGMPRGIVKKGRYLYVGDNYSNLLTKYDIYRDTKRVITVGGEPTGMTLV
jgi:YVTN family beta-propeller protein